MDDYMMKVGAEGAARLDLLNDILGPHSRRFLQDAGLRDGAAVLEVGFGTGNMTRFLATEVGPLGRVVAVDASEAQLEVARARFAGAGYGNVTFVCARAETLDLPPRSFDLACSRLVLMHLRAPQQAVARMVDLLAPGGVLACEESSANSLMTLPRLPVFHTVNDVLLQVGAAAGIDVDIGDRLYPMMVRAGLTPIVARFVQPMLPVGVAKAFVLGGVREAMAGVVKAGLVSAEMARTTLRELEELPEDEAAYYAVPRHAQVAARRA
jgi:ubiquinone/menaquinone biosynthesis C-methylase UbiE